MEQGPAPRLTTGIRRVSMAIAVVAVLGLMLHTLANVVLRTFFGAPLQGTIEYVGGWYMPVIVLVALVIAQQQGEHLEATIVWDKAPPGVKAEWQYLSYLIVFAIAILFAWFGYDQAARNRSIGLTAGASGVVVWPVTYLVPLGFLLLGFQVVLDAVGFRRRQQSSGAPS